MTDPDMVFESPADQAGWVQFPVVVLCDATLSRDARLLYALLIKYARQEGSCWPGQTTLGDVLGVKVRSVHNYMVELQEAMLVRVERRHSQTNRYVILALGLRAKRQAGTVPANPYYQQERAGSTGTYVPIKKKQDIYADKGGTRAGARVMVGGKPVRAKEWGLTERILGEFNSQTGRDLRLLTSGGQASEAAKRIYGRVKAYSDLTLEDHQRIIANTLASKWWGEGRASIGVVYGPNVFEDNIARKLDPKRKKATEREERRAKDLEAIARLRGAA